MVHGRVRWDDAAAAVVTALAQRLETRAKLYDAAATANPDVIDSEEDRKRVERLNSAILDFRMAARCVNSIAALPGRGGECADPA
jgi:hypothetical protein